MAGLRAISLFGVGKGCLLCRRRLRKRSFAGWVYSLGTTGDADFTQRALCAEGLHVEAFGLPWE